MNSYGFNKLAFKQVSLKVSGCEVCGGYFFNTALQILSQIIKNDFKSGFCFGFLNLNCQKSLIFRLHVINCELGHLKSPAFFEKKVQFFDFKKNYEKVYSTSFYYCRDFLMCFASPNYCYRLSINWDFR